MILGEQRQPGRITNREEVATSLTPDGSVTKVVVRQHLVLVGTGDYLFSIPAPSTSVRPLPDSQSLPGQRYTAITWAGFSSGRRVLGAEAVLRTREIERLLPLRIGVARAGGAIVVTIGVRPVAPVQTFDGAANASEVATKVDAVRNALLRKQPPRGQLVAIRGALTSTTLRVQPYFHVTGTIGAGRTTKPVDVTLGGSGPQLRVVLHATGRTRVRLTAAPAASTVALAPPGGGSWQEALRRGLVPRDGRALLRLALRGIVQAAYTRQYDTFLATPDRGTPSRTTYLFRTVAAATRPPVVPTQPAESGGDGILTAVGIALAALGAGALVVWWAHS